MKREFPFFVVLWLTLFFVLIFVSIGLIVRVVNLTVDEVQRRGLKAIIEEIWEGEDGATSD